MVEVPLIELSSSSSPVIVELSAFAVVVELPKSLSSGIVELSGVVELSAGIAVELSDIVVVELPGFVEELPAIAEFSGIVELSAIVELPPSSLDMVSLTPSLFSASPPAFEGPPEEEFTAVSGVVVAVAAAVLLLLRLTSSFFFPSSISSLSLSSFSVVVALDAVSGVVVTATSVLLLLLLLPASIKVVKLVSLLTTGGPGPWVSPCEDRCRENVDKIKPSGQIADLLCFILYISNLSDRADLFYLT